MYMTPGTPSSTQKVTKKKMRVDLKKLMVVTGLVFTRSVKLYDRWERERERDGAHIWLIMRGVYTPIKAMVCNTFS